MAVHPGQRCTEHLYTFMPGSLAVAQFTNLHDRLQNPLQHCWRYNSICVLLFPFVHVSISEMWHSLLG